MTIIAEAKRNEVPFRFDHFFIPLILFLGFVAAMIEAARSPDPAMAIQGWTFAACMAATGIWYMWMYSGRVPADDKTLYADGVIKAGVVASMFWAVVGMLVGVVIALQLAFPACSTFRTCLGRILAGCAPCTPRR